jgi:formate hydrogenlyase transcriptional activator
LRQETEGFAAKFPMFDNYTTYRSYEQLACLENWSDRVRPAEHTLRSVTASEFPSLYRNVIDNELVSETAERMLSAAPTEANAMWPEHDGGIVGQSLLLKQVIRQIETVASTDAAVLLLGETGTGKELFARAIHSLSARRGQQMVRANCALIPAALLENELFGHERGAFTGAVARSIGRIDLANRGTLFLDEVGDIPLELQAKLLRVLQEREFERLGSSQTIRVDFRLVAATNRNLAEMVANGQFRRDLYYRLSVFPIEIPPLRERTEDIPILVWHFVNTYAEHMNKRIEKILPEDMEALIQHGWPGNVRELQNVVERSMVVSAGPVFFLSRPAEAKMPNILPETRTLAEVEREHISQALQNANWVVGGPNGAAARLGIKRTTLLYKMRQLGISRPKTPNPV